MVLEGLPYFVVPRSVRVYMRLLSQMKDGRMFHLLTLGRGNMPGMAGRIDTADRWRTVLHVRTLQAAPPSKETPPTEEKK